MAQALGFTFSVRSIGSMNDSGLTGNNGMIPKISLLGYMVMPNTKRPHVCRCFHGNFCSN